MAKTAILTLQILADAKDAQKGLDETATSAGKLQSGVESAAVPAAAALAGLAAAGLSAAKAAAEDEQAQALLANTLRNATGASDAQIKSTEDWITKTSKAAAVADDELRPALGTLVRATGDVEESQDAMGVALDVSAATGKDLGSVSDALAKAYAGQTTSLGKLVPGMDKAVLATGDMDLIMAELARTTGGAAADAANTAAGQMEGMKIQMGEAKEAIGSALLPALSSLTGVLTTVATFVQENTTLFLVIGGIIGGVAAAILILNVAFKAYAIVSKTVSAVTKVWAAVQWLLNSALLASPITWVVLAVIALIAAIVLIATKTTWFQDIWAAVWGFVVSIATAAWDWIVSAATAALDWIVGLWDGLKSAVQAVWDWISNAIDAVLAIIVNIVTAYIGIYVAIWEGIKAAVQAVWDWIKGIIDGVLSTITGLVQGAIDAIIRIWESIKTSVGDVFDWLKTTAENALNAILAPVDAIKAAFDGVVSAIRSMIDWLGKIKMPDALSAIGDAIGSITPWAVTPPSSGSVTPVGVSTFAAPGVTSSSSGSGATIVIQGALDPVAVARQIRLILRNDERRRSGVVIA